MKADDWGRESPTGAGLHTGVTRGAHVECFNETSSVYLGEMMLGAGVFRGRQIRVRQVISHSPATSLVYGAVFAAWVSAAIYVALTR
jgi:hypothetical protein